MKHVNLKAIAAIAAIAVIGLGSCQKEPGTASFTNTENEALASKIDNGVEEDADAVSYHTAFLGKRGGCGVCHLKDRLPDCATLTESSETFPKTITIDFGSGCTDHKGRVKKGKVVIYVTDEMMNDGAERTVTFEDFYINERKVEGTRTTVNTGQNSSGNQTFSKVVSMTITKSDGSTMTRNFSGSREWISGFDTEDCNDNQFYLTGSGTVTRSDGKTASKTIIEKLHIDRNCKYIKSGVIELDKGDRTATIDFGDGTCDDKATVTKNGKTHEIDLDEAKVRGKKKKKWGKK